MSSDWSSFCQLDAPNSLFFFFTSLVSQVNDESGEVIYVNLIPTFAHFLANCKMSTFGANQNTACIKCDGVFYQFPNKCAFADLFS